MNSICLSSLFRVNVSSLTRRAKLGSCKFHSNNSYILYLSFMQQTTRCKNIAGFHTSKILLAPKQKKGKNNSDEAEVEVKLPDLKSIETQMISRITRLSEEFKTLRGGKTSTDMFNHIIVDAHGSKVPLSSTSQVTLINSSKLSLNVFDTELISSVTEAIRQSGMNLSPNVEGNTVIVTVPKPSKESRDLLLKAATKMSDKVNHYFILKKKNDKFFFSDETRN